MLFQPDFTAKPTSFCHTRFINQNQALPSPTSTAFSYRTQCLGYLEPGKFEGMTEDERHATFEMDEVRFEEGGVVVHMRKSVGEAPKR
jgi:hypothetical protein